MSEHSFLSDDQKTELAKLLDKRFNLPLVKGNREYRAWAKFVSAVDRVIASRIQDEYLEAMNDPDFQIEDVFVTAAKENLSPLLSDLLVVPILPGTLKRKLIDFVLEIIIGALANATTIDEMIESFLAES